MKRVSIGVKSKLPIFPNAAVFVKHVSDEKARQAQQGVAMLRAIFPGVPFVCDVKESNKTEESG